MVVEAGGNVEEVIVVVVVVVFVVFVVVFGYNDDMFWCLFLNKI